MTELRWVERVVQGPWEDVTVRVLQYRTWLVATMNWSSWQDVPTVKEGQ